MEKERIIDTVVFDYDGVLANSPKLFYNFMYIVAKRDNLHISPNAKNIDYLRSLGTKGRMKELGVTMKTVAKYATEFEEYCGENLDSINLYDGMQEVLDTFKGKGIRMGILSSNEDTVIRAFLAKYGIEDCFDFIYTGASLFGKAKKMKDMIKEENINKDRMVYIGDEQRDVRASKQVGIRVVAVTWGFDSKEAFEGLDPDWVIDTPKNILNIL